jgi:hypothetical protein
MKAFKKSLPVFSAFASLTAASLISFGSQSQTPANGSKAEVISSLRSVHNAAGTMGRIDYLAPCQKWHVDPDVVQHLPFPIVIVRRPSHRETLAAVHDIFSGNSDIKIKSENNRIDVLIGRPSETLLRTRISSVKFSREEQYDPNFAIGAILQTPELISAMAKLKMRQMVTFEDRVTGYPPNDAPHLESSMSDITVGQAFDTIAATFNGIVLYGACSEPHVFDVEFYWISADQ